MWRLHGRMGFMVRSTFKVDDAAQHILVIWLTGHQMMKPNNNGLVKTRILEAILHAQNELGCSVVGLGADSFSYDTGRWAGSHPEIKCAITHGDHHATGLAIEGIQRLATENFGSSLSNLTLKNLLRLIKNFTSNPTTRPLLFFSTPDCTQPSPTGPWHSQQDFRKWGYDNA